MDNEDPSLIGRNKTSKKLTYSCNLNSNSEKDLLLSLLPQKKTIGAFNSHIKYSSRFLKVFYSYKLPTKLFYIQSYLRRAVYLQRKSLREKFHCYYVYRI